MRMTRRDVVLLVSFCVALFGVALVSGRALTMHESVLPQCTREMQASGNWLLPTSGGRPWLHRPPLPHWVMLTLTAPFGRCDAPWLVRLTPLVMSTCVVLLLAWLASQWYGRAVGLLSGLILASSFQFTRYAWLAEEDTTLCAVVTATLTLFAYLEFLAPPEPGPRSIWAWFCGPRRWALLGFFVCLGLTNMAKGLIFGPLMALVPIGLVLLLRAEPRRLGKYCWFWGWAALLTAGGAWPAYVYWRFPDVLDMWIYDYGGRLNGGYIGEPWWYYWATLPWALLPWTPLAILGMGLTLGAAWRRQPPALFLWCWALGTVAFFSVPDGKHHHYLVHCLPPWALLAALGLRWLRERCVSGDSSWRVPLAAAACVGVPAACLLMHLADRVPGPAWCVPLGMLLIPGSVALAVWALRASDAARAGLAGFGLLWFLFTAGHLYAAHYVDQGREDAEFLAQVRRLAAAGSAPLYVSAELRSCLEVNRVLFHLDANARTLHNLSYLLDEQLTAPTIHLVCVARDEPVLSAIGTPRLLLQSARSRREASPDERLSLFAVELDPRRPRFANGLYIRQQQIKHREPGPWLGGVDPKTWKPLERSIAREGSGQQESFR